MPRTGRERHGIGAGIYGFDAEHPRPLVVAEVRHGRGFRDPRIPHDGRRGAGFLDDDPPRGGAIRDHARAFVIREKAIRFTGESQRLRTDGLRLEAIGLIQVAGSFETGRSCFAHVGNGEIGVQRFLESEWRGRCVFDLQRQAQFRADRDAMTQDEFVRPVRPRGVIGSQREHHLHHAIRGLRERFEPPGHRPRKAVHGRFRMARARAEPREANRHTTTDWLARGKVARGTHEEHRRAARGLEARDVAAVQKDRRSRERRMDIEAREPAGRGGKAGDPGNLHVAKVLGGGVHGARIVPAGPQHQAKFAFAGCTKPSA